MAVSVSGDAEVQISANPGPKRGGWITFPFMAATLFGLTLTSFGWILNLIIFLINEFNIRSIAAAQISNIVNGYVNMFPVVGAILADSFFGTFSIISASAFISLMGVVLLTLTATLDSLRPQPCETATSICTSPSKLQLGILYAALALASTGTGGTRFTMATAGANQFDKPEDQASLFNWFFFIAYLGSIISATAVVYTEENISWKLGFGLCAASNLLSLVIFVSGKRLYRHDKPMGSPFTRLVRVIVAAILKRKSVISSKGEDYYHEPNVKGKTKTSAAMPRESFRFLNRAALKAEGDIKPDGSLRSPWRLCSVQCVEDLKDVIRVLPLCLASIFLSTPIAVQGTLMILQALVMDRQLDPSFRVPAGSLQVITLITSCIFLMLNNWCLYPLYNKLASKPLTLLQRVGIGHVLTILSMAISAFVEAKRLKATHHGDSMSVLWLFPPLVLVGIGEAFHFPGNVALCYQEFPESLRSTATSMTSVVIGLSFYLSTALIDLIQRTTTWLPDDINRGRVDNVYWVLVIGGVLNLCYFLVCAWFFHYRNLGDDDVGQDGVSASTRLS